MILEVLTKRYPGLRAWLLQRITGLFIAIYCVGFVVRLFVMQPDTHAAWQLFFSPWWVRLATLFTWICLSEHAWIGVRDVLKDYVPNIKVRAVLTKLVAISLFVYLLWVTCLMVAA